MALHEFLWLLAIVLLAARILSEGAARLGIPSVLGELAAGLGVVWPGSGAMSAGEIMGGKTGSRFRKRSQAQAGIRMSTSGSLVRKTEDKRGRACIPDYLEKRYWWAYVRPWSVMLWDHLIAVNIILCGNYFRLRNEAISELGVDLSGKTLQIACCYGDITQKLYESVCRSGGALDVIDILPIQIENARRKIPYARSIRFMQMNSAALAFGNASYDRVLMFFLPHEQPPEIREQSIREALRVLKPDGKFVIVDYGKPSPWHPLRYLLLPVLGKLKPFAKAQWDGELIDVLPKQEGRWWRKTAYFGGLWQKIVSMPAVPSMEQQPG